MTDEALIYSSRDVARLLADLRGELAETEQELRAVSDRLDAALDALQEAVDWMDAPDGKPNSKTLLVRWRAVLDLAEEQQ